MKPTKLTEENIHGPALEKMNKFHTEITLEVSKAIASNKIVVIGMSQNPVVKKATSLLKEKNLEFTYLEYGSYLNSWKKRLAIKLWSGWPTFPQIFIDGRLVGGCTEMNKLIKTRE